MKVIPWERTADGAQAQLKADPHGLIVPVLSLLHVATRKMTEVALISADFHGTTMVFERQIGVYLEIDAHAEFMGVYVPGEDSAEENNPQEEKARRLPTLCLRRADWNRKRDVRQFREAQSKKAYIEEDEQIDSRILFITAEMYAKIFELAEEAQRMVKQGIKINSIVRTGPHWNQVMFELRGDSLVFSLSYAPYIEGNEFLEAWVEQWKRGFAEVDYAGGLIPDHGCFISYPSSLMEYLERFPK